MIVLKLRERALPFGVKTIFRQLACASAKLRKPCASMRCGSLVLLGVSHYRDARTVADRVLESMTQLMTHVVFYALLRIGSGLAAWDSLIAGASLLFHYCSDVGSSGLCSGSGKSIRLDA